MRVRCAECCALLAVATTCGGCGEPSIVEQTPRDGHLWDTEDPGAARAPPGVIVALVLICFLLVFSLARRRRAGRGRRNRGAGRGSAAGASGRPRSRGR
jgi:hypothetical protein